MFQTPPVTISVCERVDKTDSHDATLLRSVLQDNIAGVLQLWDETIYWTKPPIFSKLGSLSHCNMLRALEPGLKIQVLLLSATE